MALSIRFSRHGKKHHPIYRIVVQNKEEHPTRRFIEVLGMYYPLNQQKPGTPQFTCNEDRLRYWVGKGAVCTDRIKGLIRKHAIDLSATATTDTTATEAVS